MITAIECRQMRSTWRTLNAKCSYLFWRDKWLNRISNCTFDFQWNRIYVNSNNYFEFIGIAEKRRCMKIESVEFTCWKWQKIYVYLLTMTWQLLRAKTSFLGHFRKPRSYQMTGQKHCDVCKLLLSEDGISKNFECHHFLAFFFIVKSTSNEIRVVISSSTKQPFIDFFLRPNCVLYRMVYVLSHSLHDYYYYGTATNCYKLSVPWSLVRSFARSFSLPLSIDTLTFFVVLKTFHRCGVGCFCLWQSQHSTCVMCTLCAYSFNYVSDFMRWYCLMRLYMLYYMQWLHNEHIVRFHHTHTT